MGINLKPGGVDRLLARLSSDVNRQLQDGWILNGGVAMHCNSFLNETTVVQAMVKYQV